MNKSLKYCLDNISRSNLGDRDFYSAYTISFLNYMEEFEKVRYENSWKYTVDFTYDNFREEKIDVEVIYDCNADFEYFTSYSCASDGTLLFLNESIKKCVNHILSCQTYFVDKPSPRGGCSVVYTVGDIVVNIEHGDFGASEKPWLEDRITVMIPIKYQIN